MNKKSVWLYIVLAAMSLIVITLALVAVAAFDRYDRKNQHFYEDSSSQDNKTDETEESEGEFVLKYERETLRIYRFADDDDRQIFYDYAEINTDSLPDEVRDRLVNGIYFKGEAELYEFLQTYSS